MTPLIWLIAGIILLIMEVATPGFVICFFGLSAITVSLLAKLIPSFGAAWQWFAFSVLAILYTIFLRRFLTRIFVGKSETTSSNPDDDTTGKVVRVTADISPNIPGRVELNGTNWTAEANESIHCGEYVRILAQNNLTLKVEKVN
ncbi:MAG: NfeD family protein [Kiritimatiellae bacterium]|nr:NfeD family protein [Kiritimatiellia bacterium]